MAIIIEHSAWLETSLSKALKTACLHFTLSQTADTLAKKIVNTFIEESDSMMDILADRSKYILNIAPKLYQITEQQLLCVFHLFSNFLHLGLHSNSPRLQARHKVWEASHYSGTKVPLFGSTFT